MNYHTEQREESANDIMRDLDHLNHLQAVFAGLVVLGMILRFSGKCERAKKLSKKKSI